MTNASHLDLRDRARLIRALEEPTFDLLVIGGGITGAGVARDGAMRGLRVALIEAQDFASGTSSRSSKMIHGGLRYLAHGEVGLVREAASERKVLHDIAPHLAQPSWFILPSRKPQETALLKTALTAFEALGGVAKADRHKALTPARLSELEPLMRSERLHRGLMYREYLTDDARLTLANVRSAAAHGAVVANYVAASAFHSGPVSETVCTSTLPEEATTFRIRAKVVVNAAGPWVDELRQIEDGHAETRLALSKGVHLVTTRERLPIQHTVIINTPDKRSVFAVPCGAFTFLGTTDAFHPQVEYWPEVTRDDAVYLIDAARGALNVPDLGLDDVVSTWSGLRPLVRQEGKASNEISRKDEVWTGPGGMISIAGGKLSAYRAMAERITDLVVERLGQRAAQCGTAQEALPGGGQTAAPATQDAQASERLLRLYGDEAGAVLAEGGDVRAEARRSVLVEGALRLEDYWIRRSRRSLFDQGAGLASLEPAAAEMQALLGWSAARKALEIENCRAIDQRSRSGLERA